MPYKRINTQPKAKKMSNPSHHHPHRKRTLHPSSPSTPPRPCHNLKPDHPTHHINNHPTHHAPTVKSTTMRNIQRSSNHIPHIPSKNRPLRVPHRTIIQLLIPKLQRQPQHRSSDPQDQRRNHTNTRRQPQQNIHTHRVQPKPHKQQRKRHLQIRPVRLINMYTPPPTQPTHQLARKRQHQLNKRNTRTQLLNQLRTTHQQHSLLHAQPMQLQHSLQTYKRHQGHQHK